MNSKIKHMTYDGYSFTINYVNGSILMVNQDFTRFVDRYGNECGYNAQGNIFYEDNSPTYDELYEHWLKTKQND